MNGIFEKTIVLIILLFVRVSAQELTLNNYGLIVIDDYGIYRTLIEKDSNKTLINVKEFIPDIILDIRYATSNNFVGEPVYNIPAAYARLPVAKALKNIQNELNKENLGLKIYDAYRPYSVTIKFYEKVKDTTFVASPLHGSRHNRGCAVDLTIVDLETGEEIKMPTEYDDFTERAHHNFAGLPDEVILNREKLKSIMIKNDFEVYPAEWWHYDFIGWKNYELMDLKFEQIMGIEKSQE